MVKMDSASLRETVRCDSEFLASQGLMDYSLLLVVETNVIEE